jgi:peptide/nickel transport system permease protein
MMDSPLAQAVAEFRENRVAVAALVVVVAIALVALLAPLIAPQNPYDLASLALIDARRPPGYVGSNGYMHILGTDAQGRDLFSAILYGLRISIEIGVLAGTSAPCSGPARPISVGGSKPSSCASSICNSRSRPSCLR